MKLNIKNIYKNILKTNIWIKILIILLIIYVISILTSKNREGFHPKKKLVVKSGLDIYDEFYSDLYDDLMFDPQKNNFEINEISKLTKMKPSNSYILDIGCGTGHHMSMLKERNYKCKGLELSKHMRKKALKRYKSLDIQNGDVLNSMEFTGNLFTHINCLYFTIYYIKNKKQFFENCFKWLQPGGYLSLHLVNRDMFNPIVNSADPLFIVNPQKYAKTRITKSSVKFNDIQYKSDFILNKSKDLGLFTETFKDDKTNHVRKNEHNFYMPTQKQILSYAKQSGFNLLGKIDLVGCQYEYQYIYILYKPE